MPALRSSAGENEVLGGGRAHSRLYAAKHSYHASSSGEHVSLCWCSPAYRESRVAPQRKQSLKQMVLRSRGWRKARPVGCRGWLHLFLVKPAKLSSPTRRSWRQILVYLRHRQVSAVRYVRGRKSIRVVGPSTVSTRRRGSRLGDAGRTRRACRWCARCPLGRVSMFGFRNSSAKRKRFVQSGVGSGGGLARSS